MTHIEIDNFLIILERALLNKVQDKLMGMAQMGFPDFQKMLNSYSAIPIYLSLNANRNVKGTPGRG